MTVPLLRGMDLVPAYVRPVTPFLEAARILLDAHISALAVVDSDERVAGLFTDDDLLRGLFPRYLGELHHTAFLVEDVEALQASAQAAAGARVRELMREPVTVEIDAGPAHVVERFLHSPWGAIAVVDHGRFVGMVEQLEFTDRLLRQLVLPEP
jgi:CBS domain-containing protein